MSSPSSLRILLQPILEESMRGRLLLLLRLVFLLILGPMSYSFLLALFFPAPFPGRGGRGYGSQ
eukprot:13219426-Heterocapsa_arctica.AAC.1